MGYGRMDNVIQVLNVHEIHIYAKKEKEKKINVKVKRIDIAFCASEN